MDETPVVTAFLRHRGEILLLKRSDDVGSYSGRWGAVAGHVETSPERDVKREIREEVGIDEQAVTYVTAGEPFTVTDQTLESHWHVHPFLFEVDHRTIELNWESSDAEWVSPTVILERDTVPQLWTSYERVRPTVETLKTDSDHGSTWLSLRALEVLRDEVTRIAASQKGVDSEVASQTKVDDSKRIESEECLLDTTNPTFETPEQVVRALLEARPSMTVITNRINRVIAKTGVDDTEKQSDDGRESSKNLRAISQAAHRAIQQAIDTDRQVIDHTASEIDGKRVATLSRSGTVCAALDSAKPATVLVAESRPGSEGTTVAEKLATQNLDEEIDTATAVTLTTDAAFAFELEQQDIAVLVVGADSILADGRVINKIGTCGAAITASAMGITVLVASATDKIRPDTKYDLEPRPASELYDGKAPITVYNPTFDVTPPEYIDGIVTERGMFETDAVTDVIKDRRARGWYRDRQ